MRLMSILEAEVQIRDLWGPVGSAEPLSTICGIPIPIQKLLRRFIVTRSQRINK